MFILNTVYKNISVILGKIAQKFQNCKNLEIRKKNFDEKVFKCTHLQTFFKDFIVIIL